MAIDSLRDGFVRLCFDPSLNVLPGGCRVLVEGQYYVPTPDQGCNVTPDVPIRITSTRDINCQFGEGSVLATGLKKVFACCANTAIDIYALPRVDALTAVKAAYTLTITGPAASAGRIDLYIGEGQWRTSTLVNVDDTADIIAAAIETDLSELPDFPFTTAVVTGVITLTARNGGTVMNCLNAIVNWHNRTNYAPTGVTAVWAQSIQGSLDPAPLDYATVLGECCYCCIAGLYHDVAWQDGMIDYLRSTWSCEKPQCFGHFYTYNQGTFAQILANFTNDEEVSRMAQCCADPIAGWLKVAAYAAVSCCATVANPELSIQGPTNGLLSCVTEPESCSSCFSFDEQEQLRDNGFVVTVPVTGGTGGMTSPFVTDDVTNNLYDDDGRPNATFRDVNSRRLAAEVADEFAKKLQSYNGLALYTKNTSIRRGVKGTNPRLILSDLRAWAKDNVGVLFSEFDDLDRDLTVLTDFDVQPPCFGLPGKMHVNMIYRPPVRIDEFQVNLRPKLLDNCNT